MSIPIIDLFAGPGGLGEGFASILDHKGRPFFEIGLSIEKDPVAHRTLSLRAIFRRLRGTKDVKHYYRYVQGQLTETEFREIPAVAKAFAHVAKEARCLELGKADENGIDSEIRTALKGQKTWVLVGGPPCQAYSLAGRSRRANDKTFHEDEKHFLYTEYLRIIREHKPTIFVMENVKGLLSSQHSGNPMFERIITDLSAPADGLEYEIRSFVKAGSGDSLEPMDYVIEAEHYGIPQCRHRVILLGVRKDARLPPHQLLKAVDEPITVKHAIDDLPRIRSRLSRGDSLEAWREAVQLGPSYVKGWGTENESDMIENMRRAANNATCKSIGDRFIQGEYKRPTNPTELQLWLHDRNLGGTCQHEARSHMPSDLARYLFSACFARTNKYSPRLDVFPAKLLPDHVNVQGDRNTEVIPFKDRFRVQCAGEPATTVVAHIAKDGHYYIHYDPSQCRSLTVREAARLQTFPDNYFFAGNRTEQYTQVGNAVPPLLAHKLAQVVRSLLHQMNRRTRRNGTDTKREGSSTDGQVKSKSEQSRVLAEAES